MISARTNRMNEQRGFSLVELLVAVAILSIGLLAAATMQGVAVRSDAVAIRNNISTMVGQQIIEDLMSVDLSANSAWRTVFTTPNTYVYNRFPPFSAWNAPPVLTYSPPSAAGGIYRATYTITPNNPTTNISMVRVALTLQIGPNIIQPPVFFSGYRSIPM